MLSEVTSNASVSRALADFTGPALLVPRLHERDAAGIISELSNALQTDGCVPDVLPFYHAALNREMMANSALDCGLAFPHARLKGVKRLRFALGRTTEPVIWGPKGSWPVRLVFLIAVPATEAANYLHLLSALTSVARQPAALEALIAAPDAAAMLAVLRQTGIRQQ
jgi:mannitol/fructose-specific phosphotransferase system IIA component (Ntr-type)